MIKFNKQILISCIAVLFISVAIQLFSAFARRFFFSKGFGDKGIKTAIYKYKGNR
jgi:hypothetical protein